MFEAIFNTVRVIFGFIGLLLTSLSVLIMGSIMYFYEYVIVYLILLAGIRLFNYELKKNPDLLKNKKITFITKHKRILITTVLLLPLLFGVGNYFYQQYDIRRNANEDGIYEMTSWKRVRENEIHLYFLISEPSDDIAQTLGDIEIYLEIARVKKRIDDFVADRKSDEFKVTLKFYHLPENKKPRWQPEDDILFGSDDLEYYDEVFERANHIITIIIPPQAETKDDYKYYAGNKKTEAIANISALRTRTALLFSYPRNDLRGFGRRRLSSRISYRETEKHVCF